MSEFVEVMRHMQHMCHAYMDDISGTGCDVCPLINTCMCGYDNSPMTQEDISAAEKVIMAWAAENPEPEYPTWYEYLNGYYRAAFEDMKIISRQRIPADIAQKLGIRPIQKARKK